MVLRPRRFGKLRVEVDIAVEPSRICAWLPMHSEQPGISMRAPVAPKVPYTPSLVSSDASILVGGATHRRVGRSRLPSSSFAAARK
ncbi:hypothetical protein D3C72_2347680 [compost metagenome]